MTLREQAPTLDEFLQWPEQKPYLEFMHGKVRAKVTPDYPHSYVQAWFSARLMAWSEAHSGWTLTEQRCIVEAGDEVATVLPDVAWWSGERLVSPQSGPIRVAPTVVVEVLSPRDRYGDVQDKVVIYLAAGVMVVWVVDPSTRTVTVFRPAHAPEVVASPSILQDDALPGLTVRLDDLFSRLPASDEAPPRIQD